MRAELVTREELTCARTPADLRKWCDEKFKELKHVSGGREAVNKRIGLCKEFVEEVYPLSLYAERAYAGRGGVMIEPVLGNQNFDAVITPTSSDDKAQKVEITLAHEGENEFLRRLMLVDHGYAPAFGAIQKSGTKRTGIVVSAEPVAIPVDSFLPERFRLIQEAFDKKAAKDYEHGTDLVILFDDIGPFGEPNDQRLLEEFLNERIAPKIGIFRTVTATSWSGRLFAQVGAATAA